jgi:phage anti-repressor protein
MKSLISRDQNKLYTLSTGECFKLMLMMAKTESGNKIIQYFLKIEEGFIIVADYLREIETQK